MSAVSRIWIATVLLGLASCAWATEDCVKTRLTSAESEQAIRTAQSTARYFIDEKSQSACHIGKHRFANFDTVHQAQADGSEIWEGVGCQKGAGKSWSCFPYLQRAVLFEPGAGAPRIWVNIPLDMDAASAARVVAETYSRAVDIEASKVCSQSLFSNSYENYRHSFWNEATGELRLTPEKSSRTGGKGLELSRGDFYVVLEQISETDPTWRVACWDEFQYL